MIFGINVEKESGQTLRTKVQGHIAKNDFIEAKLVDGELYLGIPKALLRQPMVLVNLGESARLENKYVLWAQHGDRLYLETPGVIESTAGVMIPMGSKMSLHDTICGPFKIIEAKSDATTLWVNASDLFLNKRVMGWKVDEGHSTSKTLSYIKGFSFFENELVVKVFQVNSGKQHTWMEEVDYSLYLLPKPMKSRPFDHRMGFFSADNMSFNTINYRAETPKANILRWRLEKKYKDRSISDPVKPITFILPNSIPKKWRPYVKAGILEWLPAFEAAGFKNALEVKEAASNGSDMHFNSVHHNLVAWGNKRKVRGFENKWGSSVFTVTDLRTGEILSATISIGSSYQSMMDKYIIRCAPLDSRAQQYPLPDDLMGALIQSLVAHEAGHAFGLRDAHYGEYAYPFERMRDKQWLQDMGHTPSIMNYARHNYIAQPEDSISPSLLIQKVGPTDLYNIRWAYTPFDQLSPKKEKAALENMVREQDAIPWYRYNIGKGELVGPGATIDVVESDDPIASTKIGLKNMERLMELLPKINKNQKDDVLMERLYEKALDLWFKQMRQVLSLVGGYTIYYRSGGQERNVYTPIDKEVQKDALDFFSLNAFDVPDWLVCPKWRSGIHYSTFPDKPMDFQMRLLMEAIGQRRLKRLEYLEEHYKGFKGVTSEFLKRFQNSLFKELENDPIQIKDRRQELQQLYVEALLGGIQQDVGQLNATGNINYSGHSKSLFMVNLLNLKSLIHKSLGKKMDLDSYGHLKLILKKLNEME
ncbi:hypothetical protein GCM10007962_15250 [Yeosuana aromativorans]|uniref:EcxA zinc-binding domain-containing protein n=2 Tax=Yeosuana aromativorans TaxID=288019 RepID=A0A8J3BIJ4_9FLAO|nr:hypothetical protein GCM10007962_15250 [Yeosuana aromativorans]